MQSRMTADTEANCTREHFISRAVQLLNAYDKLKVLRGENDPLCEFILITADTNKKMAELFT